MYIISNKTGEIPRINIANYAKPYSKDFQRLLYYTAKIQDEKSTSNSINISDEKNMGEFLKDIQKKRYYGISYQNIGNFKNTIEFRLPNGTLDADTWIQNINLFGGIVKAAEDLSLIQKKQEDEITDEEKTMLDDFKIIINDEASEEEKLEALLEMVIPKEDRNIYRERYKVNSKIIEEQASAKEIKDVLTEKTTKKTLSIKKIGKKVFIGSNPITGPEYSYGCKIIEKDLEIEKNKKDKFNQELQT